MYNIFSQEKPKKNKLFVCFLNLSTSSSGVFALQMKYRLPLYQPFVVCSPSTESCGFNGFCAVV